jgi:transposase
MSATHTELIKKKAWLLDPAPLPGRLEYLDTKSGRYGVYVRASYYNNHKLTHDKLYLGKVIQEEEGLFHSKKLGGYFTFSTEKGFAKVEDPLIQHLVQIPTNITLHFGDVWMIDQLFKQIGLDKVMETINPELSDTLKALVAYRLTNKNDASCYAEEWYRKSYANVLYPSARLESPRISEFHEIIGKEESYVLFFTEYLKIITKNDNISDKISIPILIDSTGLQNSIKTHLTAANNHHGNLSNEIRLIYVVDKRTNLPIFFRYIPGNIIDNSILITTMHMLNVYGINIELIIMDAGYSSDHNLEQLLINKIPFLTRMTKNRKEYKRLMYDHSNDLMQGKYVVQYHDRRLCGKKVPIKLFGYDLYAYIMLDLNELSHDLVKGVNHNIDEIDRDKKIDDSFFVAGKFILLSSSNYDINEILPLYYTRQAIEQVFDICKTYAGILPLRGHSEETIRGILLISFIATTVYSYLSHGLAESKISPHAALLYMHNAFIKIYESVTLLEDLTKQQKDIFSQLKIQCPFSILEKGTPFQKSPLQAISGKKKRGRPVGSCKKLKAVLEGEKSSFSPKKRKKGRPKGSKNKQKFGLGVEAKQTIEGHRQRGRPKGSKNKRVHEH